MKDYGAASWIPPVGYRATPLLGYRDGRPPSVGDRGLWTCGRVDLWTIVFFGRRGEAADQSVILYPFQTPRVGRGIGDSEANTDWVRPLTNFHVCHRAEGANNNKGVSVAVCVWFTRVYE